MRFLSSSFAIALLALFLAVPTHADDGQEELEQEIREHVKSSKQPTQPDTPADLEALAKGILREMAVIRELPVKGPVAMQVATRAQIVSYVDSRIQEDMKGDLLTGQEAALKRLALVPEEMDVRQFLLDLYGEQVAGYYDPFKQKFFIASWMQSQLQAPIMAHELTHALQDQHFNLKPFLTPLPDNSDATSARQAIVEGDAVIAMFAYLGKQLGGAGGDLLGGSGMKIGPMLRAQMVSSAYPVFQGAPAYFREALLFPYADGADFITDVEKEGGWKKVSALYSNLPKSSEQILHPAKYLQTRDDPTAIDMPVTLAGWRQVHTDVLGEIVIRVQMSGYFSAEESARIAAGWDGDRYRAFQKGKKSSGAARGTMIVQRSVWDTTADAKEFADGMKKMMPKKYDGATASTTDPRAAKADPRTWFTTVEDGVALIELRNTEVVVVDGAPDRDIAEKMATQAWK